ncbi:MAG TPA: hypothetical protein VGO62_01590, partial [Myxococcota bacterium]
MSPRAGVAVYLVALCVLAIVLALVTAMNDPFLGNDGPSHALTTWAHDHIDDATLGYGRFASANEPWTARGFDEIFRALEGLGWRAAYRDTVVIIAELWALSFCALVTALDRKRAVVGLLGFPLALHAGLFAGLFPFVVGTAFGMLAIAAWVRREPRWLDHVVAAALLFVAARCHVVSAALAGVVMAAVTVARHPGRALFVRALALAAVGAPALAVVWLSRGALADVAGIGVVGVVGVGNDLVFASFLDRVVLVQRAFQAPGTARAVA